MLWRGRLTIAFGASLMAAVCAQLLPGEPEAGALVPVAGLDRAATPPSATSPAPETRAQAIAAEPSPGNAKAAAAASAQAGAALRAAPLEVLGHVPVAGLRRAALRGQLSRAGTRLSENVALAGSPPLQVEYTLDPGLTSEIYSILRRGRVPLGLAVVLDARSGDVLAYAGTDENRLPAGRAYPAASLVKVVTAAAAIERGLGGTSCRFVGSPYRLTPRRIVPPRGGTEITLQRALATSNNQCFAQLAAGPLGAPTILAMIDRFGLTESPAPAHEAGLAGDPGADRYLLGQLGCGLSGLSITALHAAQMAAVLADGTLPGVRWVARVSDPRGGELALPPARAPRRVLDPGVARKLRQMMTETALRGTARSAFHRHARTLLGAVPVASKTGSLSGKNPPGRYEWFIAAAPADRPRIAISVLAVQDGRRWGTSGAQLGAQILDAIFCERRTCSPALADRFGLPAAPVVDSRSVESSGVAAQDAAAGSAVQIHSVQ
jgi:hypothetical protein